ncbi:MAG: hypothetical protein IJ253_02450 [Bacteroidaceae bacterium]|nr:hypothetical protein [Bacteroidaceae bacterium]
MMTREQFILQKQEIEEQMRQTRVAEKKDLAAVNNEYELRLRDLYDDYRKQRQACLEARGWSRLKVENHYKDQRRKLWVKDCELVSRWRAQLNNVKDETSPPAEDRGLTEEGGEP